MSRDRILERIQRLRRRGIVVFVGTGHTPAHDSYYWVDEATGKRSRRYRSIDGAINSGERYYGERAGEVSSMGEAAHG